MVECQHGDVADARSVNMERSSPQIHGVQPADPAKPTHQQVAALGISTAFDPVALLVPFVGVLHGTLVEGAQPPSEQLPIRESTSRL